MKVLVFCVECNSQSETDQKYIQNVINKFYKLDTNIKIEYIALHGKGNYNKPKQLGEINERIKKGKTVVIYCIDVDKKYTNPDTEKLNQDIKNFCEKNNYEYVWFCKNIEDVFLHKILKKSEKVSYARKIGRENSIGEATEKTLSSKSVSKQSSNLMLILNKHLKRNKAD